MQSLSDRFKEFRRPPKAKRAKISAPKKSPKKKLPGITQTLAVPIVSPGEDSVSFKRHNNILKSEYKKTRRNYEVVSDLMERTFTMRRKSILENSYSLSAIFDLSPFLQEPPQVTPVYIYCDLQVRVQCSGRAQNNILWSNV